MRMKFPGVLLLLVLALSGCAEPVAQKNGVRPSVLVELPQTRQATPYTCGVAVLQSILAYNGILYRQDVLEKMVGATPEWGSNPQSLMTCLENHGIGATMLRDMTLPRLRAHIAARQPVICLLQAWNDDPAFDYSNGWDDGHYAVAIGYDAERIYFMDPSTLDRYAYICNDEFLARWHDGNEEIQLNQTGIVITNPSPSFKKDSFAPML